MKSTHRVSNAQLENSGNKEKMQVNSGGTMC